MLMLLEVNDVVEVNDVLTGTMKNNFIMYETFPPQGPKRSRVLLLVINKLTIN